MAKLTLTDLANLTNEATAIGAINANNTAIENAIENTLSRDGTSPNQMEGPLDMNDNRVLNLPLPIADTEPVRKGEFDLVVLGDVPSIAVGDTTTLNPGEQATVTNSGTQYQIVLDFGIPRGADGDTVDVGTTTTLAAGSPATVTNSGTSTALILDFGIPRGADGEMTGPGASVDGEIALYNGTAGTTLKRANQTGILKATAGVLGTATADTDYLTPTTAGTTYAPLAGNKNLTGGFTATSYAAGTKSSGTFTPDPLLGGFQHVTNNGAHTLAPPTSPCTIVLEYSNGASAGVVTTSGFTRVIGDALTTVNGNKFVLFICKTNSYSFLDIVALQ